MNTLFLIVAIVLFMLGIAHSVFGEKLLLIPIAKEKSVILFKQKPYMIGVMRFAWHITSVAWCGMALVIFDFAKVERPLIFSVNALAGTFALTGVIILAFSKGLHPAWFFFLAIAGCLWAGIYI
jgi:hypothetical protein